MEVQIEEMEEYWNEREKICKVKIKRAKEVLEANKKKKRFCGFELVGACYYYIVCIFMLRGNLC